MALTQDGDHWRADSQADLPRLLADLSGGGTTRTADAVCRCSGRVFHLDLDEDEGAAVRVCVACGHAHPIGDSADYLDDAQLERCVCLCFAEQFEITVGVQLYRDSEDVRWIYIGCRCVACGLAGCYGDWKNEFPGVDELLALV